MSAFDKLETPQATRHIPAIRTQLFHLIENHVFMICEQILVHVDITTAYESLCALHIFMLEWISPCCYNLLSVNSRHQQLVSLLCRSLCVLGFAFENNMQSLVKQGRMDSKLSAQDRNDNTQQICTCLSTALPFQQVHFLDDALLSFANHAMEINGRQSKEAESIVRSPLPVPLNLSVVSELTTDTHTARDYEGNNTDMSSVTFMEDIYTPSSDDEYSNDGEYGGKIKRCCISTGKKTKNSRDKVRTSGSRVVSSRVTKKQKCTPQPPQKETRSPPVVAEVAKLENGKKQNKKLGNNSKKKRANHSTILHRSTVRTEYYEDYACNLREEFDCYKEKYNCE